MNTAANNGVRTMDEAFEKMLQADTHLRISRRPFVEMHPWIQDLLCPSETLHLACLS